MPIVNKDLQEQSFLQAEYIQHLTSFVIKKNSVCVEPLIKKNKEQEEKKQKKKHRNCCGVLRPRSRCVQQLHPANTIFQERSRNHYPADCFAFSAQYPTFLVLRSAGQLYY